MDSTSTPHTARINIISESVASQGNNPSAGTTNQTNSQNAPNTHNKQASPTPAATTFSSPSSSSTTPIVPTSDATFASLPAPTKVQCIQLLHETQLRRNRQQFPLAIAAYDKLLQIQPGFVPAWTGKGICYKSLKDHVSAVHCFQTALQLDPKDWSAHDNLGLLFKETDLFEQAMEQYKLAIAFGPPDCPAKEHLAVVLTDYGTRLKLNGSTDKAVIAYNEALSVHPAYYPAYFNLGVVESERRNFEQALHYYNMAIDRNPNYVEALCVEENTLVALPDGKHIPASAVTTDMQLIGQHGESIGIQAIKSGYTPRFVEITHEQGAQRFTRQHLVTLRWNAEPEVNLSEDDTTIHISWFDRFTLHKHSASLPSLPCLSSRSLAFGRWWVKNQSDAGKIFPLTKGELIDVEAQTLVHLFQVNPAFIQRVAIPLVRTSDSKLSPATPTSTLPSISPNSSSASFFTDSDMQSMISEFITATSASETGPFACFPIHPASTTDQIYMLGSNESSYGHLQLKRAWADLNLSATDGIQFCDKTESIESAFSSQRQVILAFGDAALQRYVKELSTMPVVAKMSEEIVDAATGARWRSITSVDGRSVKFILLPDPTHSWLYDELVAGLAFAHNVEARSAQSLTTFTSALSEVKLVEGGRYIAIDVAAACKRYVLADQSLTHNCNIGVIKKNAGDLHASIEYYDRALKANPNFAIANSNLAIALTDLGTQVKNEGNLDEGIRLYKRALHHHSKYPAAYYNLGVAYAEKCRFDDAKVCYELAILFDPKCAEAYNNLGVIYKDRGNLDQAIHYYGQALAANSLFSQTMNNLAVVKCMLGRLDEAHEYSTRAIATNPMYAEAHNNLGVLKRDEGRIDEAIQSYEQCLAIDPLSRNAGQNRLLAMNSLSCPEFARLNPLLTPQQVEEAVKKSEIEIADKVWRAHQQWGVQFASLFQSDRYTSWEYAAPLDAGTSMDQSSIPRPLNSRRPLRIGYISADFFTHSVSYFIEAPLAFAKEQLTHITCYSNVARRDKKTAHLQSLAHRWRSVHDQNAKQVAKQIREDQIDILVELTGHTAGNRLDVLALKPAPVQVTWIGYPNTTGLPQIDYRFSDDIVDPVNTQQQYSEELIRLKGPFLCYTPPSDAPPVAPTPAASKGYITFGSFNNLAKVNDSVLSAWCKILHAVPNSRMLIKCKPFASTAVCNKIWERFQQRGIESERVDLISLLPTTSEHLDSYSQVDISVDTFPYAGTTTTCEALYCGVPVVTYRRVARPNHAHNVGASLLSRIESMKELIADSEEEYVNIAVKLAGDVEKLQKLRENLRPAMMASSLCDGADFVSNLTSTYYELFDRYLNGNKPRPSHSGM